MPRRRSRPGWRRSARSSRFRASSQLRCIAADAAAASWDEEGRTDRTDLPLVTIDPATATDLDQAFALEVDGDDLVLRYATPT